MCDINIMYPRLAIDLIFFIYCVFIDHITLQIGIIIYLLQNIQHHVQNQKYEFVLCVFICMNKSYAHVKQISNTHIHMDTQTNCSENITPPRFREGVTKSLG